MELNAIVAATSTGPVGIGDAAGETDAALVARTCAADGALLAAHDRRTRTPWLEQDVCVPTGLQ